MFGLLVSCGGEQRFARLGWAEDLLHRSDQLEREGGKSVGNGGH